MFSFYAEISPALFKAIFVVIGPMSSKTIQVADTVVITMVPRASPAGPSSENSLFTMRAKPIATPA